MERCELTVQSVPEKGTIIRICLPRAEAPAWFLSTLDLRETKRVVVLDDDPSIHQVWNNRLADADVKLIHFSDPDPLRDWIKVNSGVMMETRFLLDYELIGIKTTGIDVAIETGISDRAVLITSRFDEASVQERCAKAGIKLVPKPLAAYVSILSRKGDHLAPVDVVLIDDDELIRLCWELSAQRVGSRLVCHPSIDSFLNNSLQIPKETPIYVDLNLGGSIRGDRVTRTLSEHGYKNLYLATGELPEAVGEVPWVRAVVGKNPPFPNSLTGG